MNDKDKIPKRTAPSVKEVGCKSLLAECECCKVEHKENDLSEVDDLMTDGSHETSLICDDCIPEERVSWELTMVMG